MWIQPGNKLAIFYEVESVVDEWIFGSFFVTIGGVVVGNQADQVDLRGCLRWWRDFITRPIDRYEPGLFEASKDTVFLLLASTVLVAEQKPNVLLGEYYQNTYSRFHISHLGMSSFDTVTMVLLKNKDGLERLVWRQGDGEVLDAYFDEGEVEQVVTEAATSLGQIIDRLDRDSAQ